MTKYILNSGGSRNNLAKTDKFHKEIVHGLGQSPKILLCFFATDRQLWEEKFADYAERFLASMDENVRPKLELAFPEKFVDQVKNNDIIIIYGGDDRLLLSWLRKYNLPEIWTSKVVAGSSAGSDVLVKQFWTCDYRQIMDGLGIVPIKFIPHYKSTYGQDDPRGPIDWERAYQDLADYGDKSLPIHALEEGEFIVIEK